MRCFTRQVNGNWHASFDWAGVSYTHSLRTKEESEAEVRIGPIRDTLYRLENGTVHIPPGAEPKTFILSGGQLNSKPQHAPILTIGALADLYLVSRKVEPNTLKTLTFHFNHVKRMLGADKPLESVRLAEVQGYANARSKEKHHGKPIRPYTIRKELRSFRQGWVWAAEMGHTMSAPTWSLKSLELDKDRGREPFRTYEQILKKIKRGGLSTEEQAELWGLFAESCG